MNIALEEIPFDTPDRPVCAGVNKPCYHPNIDVLRHDAAQLIYLARLFRHPSTNLGVRGRAFPRRFRIDENGFADYDGVQGFVSTPSNNPPPGGDWIAAPLGVGDTVNAHFIESGPYRTCSAASDETGAETVCVNYPYASSGTARVFCDPPCTDEREIHTSVVIPNGSNYEFRSRYVPLSGSWWAEYYNPDVQAWQRSINVTQLGTTAMREVVGAVETRHPSIPSGNIRYTNIRAHTPGGSWHGWCPDQLIYQRMMFDSYVSSCPPPGVEPYSWDVGYYPYP